MEKDVAEVGRETNLATILTLSMRWKFKLVGALEREVRTILLVGCEGRVGRGEWL